MGTYLGYYRPHPDYARWLGEEARETGQPAINETFRQKVVQLRDSLPESLTLIGSYTVISSSTPDSAHRPPGVWIAECDDPADLNFVNNYYQGWLVFDWVPAMSVGTTSAETEVATQAATRS